MLHATEAGTCTISNPLNLALRFTLEVAALIAMGLWGWAQPAGALLAVVLPLVGALAWGTFRVRAESPNGRAPVMVSGPVRLLLEVRYFGFAIWGLFAVGSAPAAWLLAGATLLHYLASYRRVTRLLRQ